MGGVHDQYVDSGVQQTFRAARDVAVDAHGGADHQTTQRVQRGSIKGRAERVLARQDAEQAATFYDQRQIEMAGGKRLEDLGR
jgi:hypothetical protein